HDKRRTYETCNWRNVTDEIKAEFLVKARVNRCRSCSKEQRVTIRHSLGDGFSTDIGASSRAVLDDELLTQVLREPLSYQASNDGGRATCREWNNNAHRSRRIGLRSRDTRSERQRGSARGQMQKLPTEKFHIVLPNVVRALPAWLKS